ncbi:ubiquitin carboxyl-terminal hydrolase isozyme L5 [Bicyclus anynana]|uniref:Ubiquitin carboxyl-terminal hydrolase n=1 Tax=Bicyclus anynana TaxID=110368 RepID=A0A6J1N116_BICAN|nr:ubiquitin carboxyl-terminal hydrolase isozyme L5 [Bicyclus anynana]XP_023938739.1 ubiquitin carboxyl-terminal hydrolase isozyme L5 [Bicyclus anynana]XP_023938740.1 ubiquitin carboxyl-terminal hydrolase isozyme L5 [Bicyclus anynana]XP_052746626.1 ubiquitin carboxyl-terminal hydrolase isozyme L5 [Bicyclus anynana]
MAAEDIWYTVEGDPGIFTLIVELLGVRGAQFEELWTLNNGVLENLRPVHGLIFLSKYVQAGEASNPVLTDDLEDIYFAKQVAENACAAHAILNILLNCVHPDIDIGEDLTELKESSMVLNPYMRGVALTNSETVKNAHNFMSTQYEVDIEPEPNANMLNKDDDSYHYISYMEINGRLYEMDSFREGPIDHGPVYAGQNWLNVVRPIIQAKMNIFVAQNSEFKLMALVSDRKMVYERKLNHLTNDTHGADNEEVYYDALNLLMLIELEEGKKQNNLLELAFRLHRQEEVLEF